MFVIQKTDLENNISREYNMNENEDDFIRYLPRIYGIPKENLRIWMFPHEEFPFVESLLRGSPGQRFLDLSVDGVMKVCRLDMVLNELTQIEEEQITVLRTVNGVEIGWPYDDKWTMMDPEKATFLGNKEIGS